MLEMTESAVEIPPHVPAEFVREYPIVQGRYVEEDPYKTFIPYSHLWPPVFYATHAYPVSPPAWVLRRAADVREAYKDTEHFSSLGANGFAAAIGESWTMIPTELDPPLHTGFRALLNPLFSPPRMRAMEDKVRKAARHHIASFKDKGKCDFIRDFAFPFPVRSEEHTSELQSLLRISYAVFCLKKTRPPIKYPTAIRQHEL